ncbi:MAG: RNA polymerase sigma factor [Hyphomicrobiaceae bacterium]
MAIDIAALFRLHQKELQTFLRRRGASPELAADLTQEAFLRLLNAPAEAGIKNAPAYLFRTAANLSVDWARRQRVVPLAPDPEAALAAVVDEAPSPERLVISRQEIAILSAVLDELPSAVRFVFFARLDGMTFAEIARKLRISPNTAFSQMTRVMVLLKRALDHARGNVAAPSKKDARQSS